MKKINKILQNAIKILTSIDIYQVSKVIQELNIYSYLDNTNWFSNQSIKSLELQVVMMAKTREFKK